MQCVSHPLIGQRLEGTIRCQHVRFFPVERLIAPLKACFHVVLEALDFCSITGPSHSTLDANCAGHKQEVRNYMSSIRPDGSWADVNYRDQDRVLWHAMPHIDRLKLEARRPELPTRAAVGVPMLSRTAWHRHTQVDGSASGTDDAPCAG